MEPTQIGSFGPLDQMAGIDANPVLDKLDQMGSMMAQSPQDVEAWRHKQDLLGYCQKFLIDSISWRRTSFEPDWYLYRRNADSIYDPNLLVRKESWQSRAFIGLTAAHRENIQAALFKMFVGASPMLELAPRNNADSDQGDNIRDLLLREMEKTRFEKEFNMILDDATTFGSGFCRIRYETNYETRLVRNPKFDALRINDPQQIEQSFKGTRLPHSYVGTPQMVQTYRGIKFEWLSIWDIFPDPKAFKIEGNPIAYRYFDTYGSIVKGAERGYYFPEVVHLLRNAPSREIEPVDRAIVMADRTISPSYPHRTDYGRRIQCHELYMRLPKKWVFLRGEPIDDPEELVPARVLMAGEPEGPLQCVLAVELSDDYQGEPPIFKLDFIPVADRYYGRGICEMLKHYQEIINEAVNQRNDNITLTMNKMFGVIEKAIVNPADLVSKPGQFIRIDSKYAKSVNDAIMAIEIPDITKTAYTDVQELERYAQERTSANRVTLGTNGLVHDANRTATGLEILRQSAGEKFAYIGLLAEYTFLYDVFRGFWKTLYANIQPQDVIDALGPVRAQTFQLISPEQIEKDYKYEPQGIFTMENKALTQQRLTAIDQEFGNQPWLNRMAIFQKIAKANAIDPQSLMYRPEEMQQKMMADQMMQGHIMPDGGQTTRGLGALGVPHPMNGKAKPKTAPDNNQTNPSPKQYETGGQVVAQGQGND